MTSIMERLTGAAANPEGETMTAPRPRPGGYPFWVGAVGLDPACPVADAAFAARLAAVRCAFHVYGADGIRRVVLGRSDAEKWERWLLEARGDTEAWLRRYALRLACEHADQAEDILQAAKCLHDAFMAR